MSKNILQSEAQIKLFWIYKNLLTDRQISYYNYYFIEDWSLTEIADHFKISRSAVHYSLVNISKILMTYESKLHLGAKQKLREGVYHQLLDINPQMVAKLRSIDEQENFNLE